MKLLCIGGGKMAEALIGGLFRAGWAQPNELTVIDISSERLAQLQSSYHGLHCYSSISEALEGSFSSSAADSQASSQSQAEADGVLSQHQADSSLDVLVAVKPQHVVPVLNEIADLCDAENIRVLSIAAGVRIESMLVALENKARIIRVMPNTPALVSLGASAIASGPGVSSSDIAWAQQIMSAVGSVEVVAEPDLDAVTALSGSGPAYLFLFAECLTQAAIDAGLSPQLADRLTRQTLLGAASLLSQSDEGPAQLRENVTSPNGTTAAALEQFNNLGLEKIVQSALFAAKNRSIELSAQG